MKIEIREARKEDVRIVAWTVLTALDMDTKEIDKFLASCSDERNMYSWKDSTVAVVDGNIAGCLISYDGKKYKELRNRTWNILWKGIDNDILKQVKDEAHTGEYYLDSMAILPEYRGMNIGKMLLEKAIKKGKELGCEYSFLLVDVNKPRLEKYYQSMGFVKFGEFEFFGHYYNKMKYAG